MLEKEVELKRRTKVAHDAITRTLGTEAGRFGAALFVSHHLEQLDPAYWETHLGTEQPKPEAVLGLLRLLSHWSDDDEDGIDVLDFGLPGNASQYLLSVQFDANGEVEGISMES